MEPKEDPLRRDMRVERTRREDGRTLLLYSWPDRAGADRPRLADEPSLDPRSRQSGPADV